MRIHSKTANKLICRTHTDSDIKKTHNEMQKRADLPANGADITETRANDMNRNFRFFHISFIPCVDVNVKRTLN